jgi:hypothetical protein
MERLENKHAMSFAQTKTFGQGQDFQEVLKEAQKYIKDPNQIKTSDLPESFEWTNFNGHDFVGVPRD